jgi:hypothetical protein
VCIAPDEFACAVVDPDEELLALLPLGRGCEDWCHGWTDVETCDVVPVQIGEADLDLCCCDLTQRAREQVGEPQLPSVAVALLQER